MPPRRRLNSGGILPACQETCSSAHEKHIDSAFAIGIAIRFALRKSVVSGQFESPAVIK